MLIAYPCSRPARRSVIDKQLPEAGEGLEPLDQPTDPDARAAWPWWKLKKWALRLASLFIQR